MRCYFFTNFYYSSIQQGIQPLHAVVDMFVKYDKGGSHQKALLFDWAKYHKTAICLNAGNYAQMVPLLDFLEDSDNPYPFAPFHEEKDAMGAEVLTSIGIVLPERIYEVAGLLRSRTVDFDTDPLEEMQGNTSYVISIDERARERMSMAEQVKLEQALKSYGPYTLWEITFITKYLNMCGLAR